MIQGMKKDPSSKLWIILELRDFCGVELCIIKLFYWFTNVLRRMDNYIYLFESVYIISEPMRIPMNFFFGQMERKWGRNLMILM